MISFPSLHAKALITINEEDFISSDFKEDEVRPLYKNDGRADKSNYRPINILPNVLKTH